MEMAASRRVPTMVKCRVWECEMCEGRTLPLPLPLHCRFTPLQKGKKVAGFLSVERAGSVDVMMCVLQEG